MEIKRGLMAGFLAGIISGIIFGVLITFLNVTLFYNTITEIVDYSLSQIPEELKNLEEFSLNKEFALKLSLYGKLLMPVGNSISGLIFGFLFALLFSRLPGRTAIGKGIFLGVVIGSIFFLFGFLTLTEKFRDYFLFLNIIDFFSNIFFGFLLGVFWDKLKK